MRKNKTMYAAREEEMWEQLDLVFNANRVVEVRQHLHRNIGRLGIKMVVRRPTIMRASCPRFDGAY